MTVVGIDELQFGEDGLVPVAVQDRATKEVLMLAFMSRESLEITLETRKVTFWSRSRKKLWTKGEEESGNYLLLVSIQVNCENNSLLVLANPMGPTCHTGSRSCYSGRVLYPLWADEPIPHGGILKTR